jgi:hypothetical protein
MDTVPQSFFDGTRSTLATHATYVFDRCSAIDGLTPTTPQGAMYIMIGIDHAKFEGIADAADFAQQLLNEKRVFCLPGSCEWCLLRFAFVCFCLLVFCCASFAWCIGLCPCDAGSFCSRSATSIHTSHFRYTLIRSLFRFLF